MKTIKLMTNLIFVRASRSLISRLDKYLEGDRYQNRTEIIEDIIKEWLVCQKIEEKREVEIMHQSRSTLLHIRKQKMVDLIEQVAYSNKLVVNNVEKVNPNVLHLVNDALLQTLENMQDIWVDNCFQTKEEFKTICESGILSAESDE